MHMQRFFFIVVTCRRGSLAATIAPAEIIEPSS
jgi:hypothetical protein